MKEKKKVKRFKRILPFICVTLLLLGSCMTVCAADYSDVDISEFISDYPYYCLYKGSDCVCIMISEQPIVMTKNASGDYTIPSGYLVYYSFTEDNGVTWSTKKSMTNSFVYASYLESSAYTNHDIFSEDGELFFRHPPIVELVKPLRGIIQNQTQTILPIVIGCLALLIGSLILVPKLKIFVLK